MSVFQVPGTIDHCLRSVCQKSVGGNETTTAEYSEVEKDVSNAAGKESVSANFEGEK